MNRNPNLKGQRLEEVVRIIRSLSHRASWNGIADEVNASLGVRYSRQALQNHPSILLAYRERRDGLSSADGACKRPVTKSRREEKKVKDREEIEKLRKTISAYQELFVLWSYNARLHNMTEADLNRAIPSVHRA